MPYYVTQAQYDAIVKSYPNMDTSGLEVVKALRTDMGAVVNVFERIERERNE
tara:strand:- start:166 stop:321 length:156 start_codon:yes stop_codon:yes gene_type:complete